MDKLLSERQGSSSKCKWHGISSYPTSVDSGVPQGSVLGPLLFIIFINDLPNKINQSNVLTFADDTKLTKRVCEEKDCSLLQKDLNYVIKWSQNNMMKLNNDKFELICHKPSLKTKT